MARIKWSGLDNVLTRSVWYEWSINVTTEFVNVRFFLWMWTILKTNTASFAMMHFHTLCNVIDDLGTQFKLCRLNWLKCYFNQKQENHLKVTLEIDMQKKGILPYQSLGGKKFPWKSSCSNQTLLWRKQSISLQLAIGKLTSNCF